MLGRNYLASPVTWVVLFVLLAGVPLAALGWLGWRVLEQERALEERRQQDQLENAASLVAREIDRSLAVREALLPLAAQGQPVPIPAKTVLVVFDANGVVQQQGLTLPFYPRVAARTPTASTASSASLFADAEAAEFRTRDLPGAAALYRRLAETRDPHVRASALVRLARVLRAQRRVEDALAVYRDLAELGGVFVAGSPAALVAYRERAALLDDLGRRDASAEEKRLLATALANGPFPIDRATFDFYRESAPDFVDESETGIARRLLTAAVDRLWAQWEEQPEGRVAWTDPSGNYVAIWRRTPSGTVAMAGDASDVITAAAAVAENFGMRLTLDDSSGVLAWGEAGEGAALTRSTRETGLPWAVHVSTTDTAPYWAIATGRRTVFAGGFVLIALVITGAAYSVFRAVHRELSVARLQSDFVAAVSHEFRTPLTAMCHLTELLEEGGAASDRLPQYYQALGRESRRLHTMVENLLDFGRIDAGRRQYEFATMSPVDLVDDVVQMCRDHVPDAARRLQWVSSATSASALGIRADREALSLAIRNLIDNALKYSSASSPVTVRLTTSGSSVSIAITDEGAGIAKDERRSIFRKFARGSAAKTFNVKGTGIGLAMTELIVKAHGGSVAIDSTPGRGSTFTIRLQGVALEDQKDQKDLKDLSLSTRRTSRT